MAHWSSCAVHNEPALPKGECDCGNDAPEPEDAWVSVNSISPAMQPFCRGYMAPEFPSQANSPAVMRAELNITAYIRHVLETRDAQR